MPDAPLFTVEGLVSGYGGGRVLHGVDLALAPGEILGLLGRNGAGKTTTMRTIMGLWHASAGSVTLDGRDITAAQTPDISRLGVAYVPENMAIFAGLTVRENLVLAARSGPLADDRLDWIFGLFPALKKFWALPAGNLSGGQKQMLAIARAVVEPRDLILIDEPTKGLAPAIVQALIEAVNELKATDTTILMVEHNLGVVSTLCDTITVLQRGAILTEGTYAEVSSDKRVKEAYMGKAA